MMGLCPWQPCLPALLSGSSVQHQASLAGEGSLLQGVATTSNYGTNLSGSAPFSAEKYSLLINPPGK